MKKTTDPFSATLAKRCWKHGLLTLAVSMIAFPSLAVDGIRPETQELVRQTQAKHPDFRLSDDAKRCLAGIEKDPECDEFINDEIKEFIRGRQIAEREHQVNMAQEARGNNDIAIALLQTVVYREFGLLPEQTDYRTKVQGYAHIRPEVRALIQRNLLEPRTKDLAAWKNDLPQAMEMARQHIDASIGIQKKLTDLELAKGAGMMNVSTLNYYRSVKQKLSPGR